MTLRFSTPPTGSSASRSQRAGRRRRRCCARRASRPCGRIGALASEHRVDAVLVAGDVFDANLVRRRDPEPGAGRHARRSPVPGCCCRAIMMRALAARRLDPAAAAGPSRPTSCSCRPQPVPITWPTAVLVVLPAPLTARRTLDDLTAWMDDAATARVRCGSGWPTARWRAACPARGGRAPTRSPPSGRPRARLDYLALGDWHGMLEIAPADLVRGHARARPLRANEPGHALLVEFDAPGAPPRVERIAAASYRWHLAVWMGPAWTRMMLPLRSRPCCRRTAERHRAVLRLTARRARRPGYPGSTRCGAGARRRRVRLAGCARGRSGRRARRARYRRHWRRPPRPRLRRAACRRWLPAARPRSALNGELALRLLWSRLAPERPGVKLRRSRCGRFRKLAEPVQLDGSATA